MHQSLQGATFHVEHIVPCSLGGTSQRNNLAGACPNCNLHKSYRIDVQRPDAPGTVPIFNPRADAWEAHFCWDGFEIIRRTPLGRATIDLLRLKHERRIKVRQAEALCGLFPPNKIVPLS